MYLWDVMETLKLFFSIYKTLILKMVLFLIPCCAIFSYAHGFWSGVFFGFWVLVLLVFSLFWTFRKAIKANGKSPFK
jgi:uncharacterized protein (DUF58 family)